MVSLLYVTDLTYPAQGRRYGDEDVYLTSRLRERASLAIAHPLDAPVLLDRFDLVVVRNSGPVIHYPEAYAAFRARAEATGTPVYNPLTGRGDMRGKQYLVDLTAEEQPVVPTADSHAGTRLLPPAATYVVKPKHGADSVGLRRVPEAGLAALPLDGDTLVQPAVDLVHEVSFVFVDHELQYALYAPDRDRRWEMLPFEPGAEDVAFAQRFVDWNTLEHGIQRVDACRTQDGSLLLMELEDLNPYLSLDVLDEVRREAFVEAVWSSIEGYAGAAGRLRR